MQKLTIATRKSKLALWQANFVKTQLEKQFPKLTITLIELSTEGDENQIDALNNIGGKSLFVKKIQAAVLQKKADMAVHSIKDMSVYDEKGLTLAAILEREDARDVFISNHYTYLSDLPANALVGTGSPRRECLIRALRPDVSIQLLRGNVDTRLQKVADGEFDAVILAAAGVKRLGMIARIQSYFSVETFTPAIGQGAIGVECREADEEIQLMLQKINHEATALCVQAERSVNRVLQGDCHSPIGAHAYLQQNQLHLHAMVGSIDGKKIINVYQVGDSKDALDIGKVAAEKLLADGAKNLLEPYA
ncbi:MAG: hypothetical protein ACD_42C00217G0002 [uncultured bacterium]|nr:MAG: hypothetical protein ACD_42C00217G0002 [uncultured bacterium]OGT25402.1 MAG: hydroxymethylbilane synthase [Gammaproteobacteria bacterium RIFCSPHIGHO2_02_FULL_42_43]OGT27689.1 MAG: hydroxymethylbilane synthase [Gammaproteobacteria bacterium RIFCSPHIGHO2_01_FULL_42_8]OGT51354.1 MAG: hydroxymethylbilane synthase [Gammaproteobacteria bacterium RIFCSPHIGHO2_12_FULL_41_25]OGT62056.1 MAG: hydroxymethylbilane synthase [Gammaproteobacteria bacterium RIFCSPLOWO2_02_FULL_42_14]OGT85729.1 MAG: hyd